MASHKLLPHTIAAYLRICFWRTMLMLWKIFTLDGRILVTHCFYWRWFWPICAHSYFGFSAQIFLVAILCLLCSTLLLLSLGHQISLSDDYLGLCWPNIFSMQVWARHRCFIYSHDALNGFLLAIMLSYLATEAGGNQINRSMKSMQMFRVALYFIGISLCLLIVYEFWLIIFWGRCQIIFLYKQVHRKLGGDKD